MKALKIITVVSGLVFASYSNADWHVHRHSYRYEEFNEYKHWLHDQLNQQQQRIRHGIKQGLLTARESGKLYRQQEKINDLICRYEHDGYFSNWEQRKLERRLERADEYIYKLKHNRFYARLYDTGNVHRHHHHGRDVLNPYASAGMAFSMNPYDANLYFRW